MSLKGFSLALDKFCINHFTKTLKLIMANTYYIPLDSKVVEIDEQFVVTYQTDGRILFMISKETMKDLLVQFNVNAI